MACTACPAFAAAQPAAAETDALRREALLGVLGDIPDPPPSSFRILESVRVEQGWRHKVEYLAEAADHRTHEPADLIRAYLFVPDHAKGARLPAILAIHQDGPRSHLGKDEPAGLAGDDDQHYGLELFRRGYVVLCPDRLGHAERRRLGTHDINPIDLERDNALLEHRAGQLLMKGRTLFGKEAYDLSRGVDMLASLDYVDAGRIGAIGHSAGGNALVYLMFIDPRVKAGVSSCGFFDLANYYDEAAPKRRSALAVMPGLLRVGQSADFLAFIAPRPVLLTRGTWEWGSDGEWKTFSERHVAETRSMVSHAQQRYEQLGAPNSLRVEYFDDDGGNHAFPPRLRELAYGWLDVNLRNRAAN